MNGIDPDIQKLFHHVRMAVDALEKIIVRNPLSRGYEQARVEQDERRKMAATDPAPLPKLAYTLKEVRELVGISRSAIYLALAAGDLRAIKSGRKTLVLAKDLQAWLKACRQNLNQEQSLSTLLLSTSHRITSCSLSKFPFDVTPDVTRAKLLPNAVPGWVLSY